MSDNKNERDDFWDISRLLPQKKHANSARPQTHTYDTEAEPLILTATERTSDSRDVKIEVRSDENMLSFAKPCVEKEKIRELTAEYSPNTPFIENVKIFKRNDFRYYADFYNDGMKYLSESGFDEGDQPFFSYVPQYSQLSARQKNRYFYLRNELRCGRTPSMPYSYLLLYIFELINVEPDREAALDMLCFIWNAYEKHYTVLASLMPEWVTDYALLNKLIPKPELLKSVNETALTRARIAELFIPVGGAGQNKELAVALIKKCSSYDYKKSKFATGEDLKLYDKYIPLAIERLIEVFKDKNGFFVCEGSLKRAAFASALCTPNNKFDIEVKYCSVSHSYEMKFIITDAIKHIENRIRAYIGVKSRLTVYSLPVSVRECLDDFLDRYISGKRQTKKVEIRQEYEKLYDLPKKEFSLNDARRIEETSWQTTRLLIETFEDETTTHEPIAEPAPITKENTNDAPNPQADDLISALSEYMPFIKSALACDASGERVFAEKKGRLIDTVADEINEIASDVLGDIILEKEDDVYTVIADYAEEFEDV